MHSFWSLLSSAIQILASASFYIRASPLAIFRAKDSSRVGRHWIGHRTRALLISQGTLPKNEDQFWET